MLICRPLRFTAHFLINKWRLWRSSWRLRWNGRSASQVTLPKKSHMQRFGFRRRRSEELSSNFREDMAPISAAIVLQEKKKLPPFFSSSTFWRTRATWDGQLKESGQHTTATFSREVQGEQQEYWFPFSLWHKYWSRLHYWKTANPMICFCTVCTSAKYRHFQLKSTGTKTYDTKVNLAFNKVPHV